MCTESSYVCIFNVVKDILCDVNTHYRIYINTHGFWPDFQPAVSKFLVPLFAVSIYFLPARFLYSFVMIVLFLADSNLQGSTGVNTVLLNRTVQGLTPIDLYNQCSIFVLYYFARKLSPYSARL